MSNGFRSRISACCRIDEVAVSVFYGQFRHTAQSVYHLFPSVLDVQAKLHLFRAGTGMAAIYERSFGRARFAGVMSCADWTCCGTRDTCRAVTIPIDQLFVPFYSHKSQGTRDDDVRMLHLAFTARCCSVQTVAVGAVSH